VCAPFHTLTRLFLKEQWEDYHQMLFTYLPHVDARLQAIPWSVDECLQHVTPEKGHIDEEVLQQMTEFAREKGDPSLCQHPERFIRPDGFVPGRLNLSPQGLLQVCILWSQPFREMPKNQVRDVRDAKALPDMECRDRRKLVEMQAEALTLYNLCCQDWYGTRGTADLPRHSLTYIKQAVDVVLAHRRRGIPLTSPALRDIDKRTIQNAYKLIASIVTELTPADYGRVTWPNQRFPSVLFTALITCIWEGFKHYGPPAWPNIAIRHASAAILNHVGVRNEGTTHVTAEAIRKRLQPGAGTPQEGAG
jgi:hypothetical protein